MTDQRTCVSLLTYLDTMRSRMKFVKTFVSNRIWFGKSCVAKSLTKLQTLNPKDFHQSEAYTINQNCSNTVNHTRVLHSSLHHVWTHLNLIQSIKHICSSKFPTLPGTMKTKMLTKKTYAYQLLHTTMNTEPPIVLNQAKFNNYETNFSYHN